MINKDINSLGTLQEELAKLKIEYHVREIQLKDDAKLYIKQFSPISLIKGLFTSPTGQNVKGKANLSGIIMAFILPLIVNKTIFRGSGFITKSIATLISGKIGKSLDLNNLSHLFEKAKNIFGSRKNKNAVAFVDYGIPPDSETY